MAASTSKSTVILAFSVNLFIAIIKFFIWGITGSSAFFSEAIHSVVDSSNQAMLWYGQTQSGSGPNSKYPLGRGKEEYFWALVVAVVFFTLGGIVSLQHGIEALSHPKKLENLPISIVVLIGSILLETYVLIKATKQIKKGEKKNSKIMSLLRKSTDGSLIAIIVEDFAATLGLVIALVGVSLSYFTGNAVYDGASSILIGILLMVSGIFLGYEMKHLIVGESVDPVTKKSIYDLIKNFKGVNRIIQMDIVVIGKDAYLLLGNIDYNDKLDDLEISELNNRLFESIKSEHSKVSDIFINTISD